MLCYFDNDEVNLSHVDEIKNVRPLAQLKTRLSNSCFQFAHTTEYTQGVYVIEVSKHVPHWGGYSTVPSSKNLLLEIPNHVIRAVKEKKIRIVILATIEGDDYISEHFDGYKHLNYTAQILNLPRGSIIIASGNLIADTVYKQWCKNNHQLPMLEFIGSIEWDGKDTGWQIPSTPLIYSSLETTDVKDFNSLNRSHKPHRTDHLYYLAKNKMMDNIISGGFYFDTESLESRYFTDTEYQDVLHNNYPRVADIAKENLTSLAGTHPSHTTNFSIYIKSLLTVVTESHYSEKGLFITEKTMRPLALGHPFVVLGQPNLHEKLNELGFKTNFFDSYDHVLDDLQRFHAFHETLLKWKNMSYASKTAAIEQWLEYINHNFQAYRQINFKRIMFDTIIDSTKKYFLSDL
jgi:hypothetical protein